VIYASLAIAYLLLADANPETSYEDLVMEDQTGDSLKMMQFEDLKIPI
jgi:hypothetical protein